MSGTSGDRFRWEEVMDHVRDICLVLDAATGRILDGNAAAIQAYGYSRDELLARRIFDLRIDRAGPVEAQMRSADSETDGILFETMHRRADGTTFPVEVSARAHTIGPDRVLISIVRDITERHRHAAEREQLLVATQAALAARDEFLLIASHELRTPISVMGLQLHQIRRLIARGEATDRVLGAAEAAASQIERLDALVKVLLDVTRIASGQLELERTWVELPELIDDVVGRMRDQATRAGTVISTDVAAIRGQWDRLRLDQALTNLVGNAIKYGGGSPVDVSSRTAGGAIQIEVRDRGIGFTPEDRARIFDKFVRAAPLAKYGGLGLGLFITRQIVEAHGGSIDADGAPGQGATFRIVLPQEPLEP